MLSLPTLAYSLRLPAICNMRFVYLTCLVYPHADSIYKVFIIGKKKYGIIKSSNAYHVVKFNGYRPTSFDSVKNEIFNLVYQQRMMEQYEKWVSQKRSESDIKIYMNDYVKENAAS